MAAEPKRPNLADDPRARMPATIAIGRKLSPHEDIYHFVLTLTWPRFFLFVSIGFALVNAIFAVLYLLAPGCIANASSFADLFFFSVQTLGTIGYGAMAPATRYGNVIVSFEALVGILMTAIVTGMTFVRFARPTAKILFSDKAVIMTRDGVPHLMFRLANWRRNQIVEAALNVSILLTERTKEGDVMRRPQALELVRRVNPMFALTWTVMHKIDESSPLHGAGLEKLKKERAELFVSVTGYDETIAQTIHARYRYAMDDVVVSARFADVLVMREDGTRVLDYDKFHDIVRNE